MKNLFFILVCLFISAELCAQGDESENNPETPLKTNQLETSESSEENADAETSEQLADEERFELYYQEHDRIKQEKKRKKEEKGSMSYDEMMKDLGIKPWDGGES